MISLSFVPLSSWPSPSWRKERVVVYATCTVCVIVCGQGRWEGARWQMSKSGMSLRDSLRKGSVSLTSSVNLCGELQLQDESEALTILTGRRPCLHTRPYHDGSGTEAPSCLLYALLFRVSHGACACGAWRLERDVRFWLRTL